MMGVAIAFDVEIVFRNEAVFVHAEIPRDRTNKAAVEDAAGQLVPAFAFDGFQEATVDAGGGGNLFKGDTAHLTFALEMLAERCRGHQGPGENIGGSTQSVNAARRGWEVRREIRE